MISLGELLTNFFAKYLADQNGLSENTILSYRDCIKILIQYSAKKLKKSADRLNIEDITNELIIDFLDYLEKERNNIPATRNTRLAAIKSFFRFLALNEPTLIKECERVCSIRFKKTEQKVIEPLNDSELKAILQAPDQNSLGAVRDYAMLILMAHSGARVQEIVDLNIEDIRLEAPAQVKLTGKGRKQRIIPLSAYAVQAIAQYRQWQEQKRRRSAAEPAQQSQCASKRALFLNAGGNRLTRFGINHILGKHKKAAQIKCPSLKTKPVSPHILRHTAALNLVRAGNDICIVQNWLGHADPKTTSLYFEINLEMKTKALEACELQAGPGTTSRKKWHNQKILTILEDLTPQGFYVNQ